MSLMVFDRVVAATSSFDALDLLASVAALQLLPANVSRTVRLEVLAHAVASRAIAPGLARASLTDLSSLCNEHPLASFEIVRNEDPPESHFVEPMAWRSDPALVFPGISDDSTFTFRHLASALNAPLEFHRHPTLLAGAQRLIGAVLCLSTEVAHRARLKRWTPPEQIGRDTLVPASATELDQLKGAVSFLPAELDELLKRFGGAQVLEPILSRPGVQAMRSRRCGPLFKGPVVQVGDRSIVALPGALLDATRHKLIVDSVGAQAVEDLASRFSDRVWGTVDESLRRLGMALASHVLPLPEIPNARSAVYQFDNDKFAHAILITDPLHGYDEDTVFGYWALEPFQSAIDRRVHRAVSAAKASNGAAVMTLLVLQGVGREHVLSLDSPPRNFLALRAAELETLGYAEGGRPLALWKFVQARERLATVPYVHATCLLDEFELYRSHRHTYYLSDEAPPDLLSIGVGTGFRTRAHVANRYDPHSETIETGASTSLVMKAIDAGVPVYGDISRAQERVAFFVDGLPVRLWVLGPAHGSDTSPEVRSLSFDLVKGLAYWLWQFTPGLVKHLRPVPDQRQLSISLDVTAAMLDASLYDTRGPAFEAVPEGNRLTVRFSPSAVPMFMGMDNEGERAMMKCVLAGLANMPIAVDLDAGRIAQLVDASAPLGNKKQLFFLNLDHSPDLDWTDVPDERLLDEADVEGLLDDLGVHLRDVKRRTVGAIARPARIDVLHECVEYFYSRLQDEVSALTGSGTLEGLVRRHEALIQQTSFRAFTVPTRLACFGELPDMVAELTKEIPERARVAIASRFLIEYVAASPPKGSRELSGATYDRLLAISHHVANFGFISDLLHFRLADTRLAILASGRLGIESDRFREGLSGYLAAYASDVRGRSIREFAKHWRQGTSRASGGLVERLKGPSEAEFGASLADYVDLMIAALSVLRETGRSVGLLPRGELIRTLVERLSWTSEKVGDVIDRLTIAPRDKFLGPPAPFKASDVYPWKFGRRLSYLRRPFLRVGVVGDPQLLWGMRQMFHSAGHLIELCVSGRLHAETAEMRTAMAEINHERGRSFNDGVVNVLSRDGRIVEARKSRFGSLRMPRELGDIDVFVLERTTRRIAIVECKDLALARTPRELANQLQELTGAADEESGSAVARHARRVEWIRGNLPSILLHFGIQHVVEAWELRGMFVVDEPLFATHLRDIGMEVRSLEALRASDVFG